MKKYLLMFIISLFITSCSSSGEVNKTNNFIEVGSGLYKKVEELKTIGDTGNLTIEELRKLDKDGVKNENLTKLKDLCKSIGIDNCLYINGNPSYYYEYNNYNFFQHKSDNLESKKEYATIGYENAIKLEVENIKSKGEFQSYINNFWKGEYFLKIDDYIKKYIKNEGHDDNFNFIYSYFRNSYTYEYIDYHYHSHFTDTIEIIFCTKGYNLGVKLKDLPSKYLYNCTQVYKRLLDLEEKNSPEYRKKVEDAINKEIKEIDSKIE